MEVGLHQLVADVHVVEVLDVAGEGGHHVGDADDVLVAEVLEELDLAEDALGVDLVVEGAGDHLDGHLGLGGGIEAGDDDAVGSGPDDADEGVLGIDREGLVAGLEGVGVVRRGLPVGGSPVRAVAVGTNGAGGHVDDLGAGLGHASRRSIVDGVGMGGGGRRGRGGGVVVGLVAGVDVHLLHTLGGLVQEVFGLVHRVGEGVGWGDAARVVDIVGGGGGSRGSSSSGTRGGAPMVMVGSSRSRRTAIAAATAVGVGSLVNGGTLMVMVVVGLTRSRIAATDSTGTGTGTGTCTGTRRVRCLQLLIRPRLVVMILMLMMLTCSAATAVRRGDAHLLRPVGDLVGEGRRRFA